MGAGGGGDESPGDRKNLSEQPQGLGPAGPGLPMEGARGSRVCNPQSCQTPLPLPIILSYGNHSESLSAFLIEPSFPLLHGPEEGAPNFGFRNSPELLYVYSFFWQEELIVGCNFLLACHVSLCLPKIKNHLSEHMVPAVSSSQVRLGTSGQTEESPPIMASQVVLVVKNLLANARGIRDLSSIPDLGRSHGGGNVNPLQCSCLENP